MNRMSWKEIILGTFAGLSVLASPAVGKVTGPVGGSDVRIDTRGHGSLNSGREGGDSGMGQGRGNMVVAQADDVRQEDRRQDRREDRREDRRDNQRSNASGELRGLDRADHVAGEHGREGRENARMRHERPHRPERMERIERPDRPEKPERPERPEKPERSGRN